MPLVAKKEGGRRWHQPLDRSGVLSARCVGASPPARQKYPRAGPVVQPITRVSDGLTGLGYVCAAELLGPIQSKYLIDMVMCALPRPARRFTPAFVDISLVRGTRRCHMWSGKTELELLVLGSEFVLFPLSVPSNEAVSHNTNNTALEESRIAWGGLLSPAGIPGSSGQIVRRLEDGPDGPSYSTYPWGVAAIAPVHQTSN